MPALPIMERLVKAKSPFDESKHPRGPNGRWIKLGLGDSLETGETVKLTGDRYGGQVGRVQARVHARDESAAVILPTRDGRGLAVSADRSEIRVLAGPGKSSGKKKPPQGKLTIEADASDVRMYSAKVGGEKLAHGETVLVHDPGPRDRAPWEGTVRSIGPEGIQVVSTRPGATYRVPVESGRTLTVKTVGGETLASKQDRARERLRRAEVRLRTARFEREQILKLPDTPANRRDLKRATNELVSAGRAADDARRKLRNVVSSAFSG